MPKVTVDGVEIEVPQGATVLQACELAGKEIPRFCYHERLSIAGNCRMCLVEVAPGPPKPQASCALPAADGQTIRTDTRDGEEGPRRGDGVPAHQPPARLPDLRPGRRVRPSGPGDGLWPSVLALRREQASHRRQVHGPGHQDRHDALHPVHALHPLLRGSGGRAGAWHALPGRGQPDHVLPREGRDHRDGRQSRRRLPGRSAASEATGVRKPSVGASPRSRHRRHGCGRIEHPLRCPPAAGHAHPPARQRRRERGVDQRQDAASRRCARPQPPRPPVGAREGQASRGKLGRGARPVRQASEEGRCECRCHCRRPA